MNEGQKSQGSTRTAKTPRAAAARRARSRSAGRGSAGDSRQESAASTSTREPLMEVRSLQLVTQRKSLEEVEPIWLLRWLLRQYFKWRGFACRSHCGECDGKCYASIEYRGVFDDDAMAYHAARCAGGEVKPIPFNAALPEETVRYEVGDVPLSEASPWYRRGVMLPFVAVPRKTIKDNVASLRSVEARLDQLDDCIKGTCVKAL